MATNNPYQNNINNHFFSSSSFVWLRKFSKLVAFSTLFLIFVGGMVTSTDSGLAVPDWPLSYGMLFPPMVGGVFYEHGHRMVAATVGFLMLLLSIWLGIKEKRPWVKKLGFVALATVILQGVLGGITVLFFLPTPISVLHAVLAQTFFILTIVIAYSLSCERRARSLEDLNGYNPKFLKLSFWLIILIFIQLIAGAIMRHTGSGLAIPDFPKVGGHWFPLFDKSMLLNINHWRFDHNLDPVTWYQIAIHFLHRVLACVILIFVLLLNKCAWKLRTLNLRVLKSIYLVDLFIVIQIILGIFTVLTHKAPTITSLHVVTGAATLGLSVLLFLRASPLAYGKLKRLLAD